MTASASAKMARPISRSNTSCRLRMIPNLERVPPVRRGRDRRVLGAGAQERRARHRCWRLRVRTCRSCVPPGEMLSAKGGYRLRPPRPRARWCWWQPARKSRSRSRRPPRSKPRASALTSSRCRAGKLRSAAAGRLPIAPTSCPMMCAQGLDRGRARFGWERYVTGSDGLTHRHRHVRCVGARRSAL
jgi:hypothetical protein